MTDSKGILLTCYFIGQDLQAAAVSGLSQVDGREAHICLVREKHFSVCAVYEG